MREGQCEKNVRGKIKPLLVRLLRGGGGERNFEIQKVKQRGGVSVSIETRR